MKVSMPFSTYDFFAYLISGTAVILAVLYVAQVITYPLRPTDDWGGVVLIGVGGYIAGEIIASLAGSILEHWAARRVHEPCRELWKETEGNSATIGWKKVLGQHWRVYLFGRYYRPLKKAFQDAIKKNLPPEIRNSKPFDYEAAYLFVYACVRRDPDTALRLDESRNQYAFARNIAMAGLLNALVFLGAHFWSAAEGPFLLLALISLGVAVGMALRFFKFYSTFYAQVFRAYLPACFTGFYPSSAAALGSGGQAPRASPQLTGDVGTDPLPPPKGA